MSEDQEKLFYKEQSKLNWWSTRTSEEQLKIGCLMRIADATEAMAKEHNRLVEDRNYYERMYRLTVDERQREIRRNSALRGVITKLKAAKP